MATPLDTDISDSSEVKPKGWVKSIAVDLASSVEEVRKSTSQMAKKTLTLFMRKAWKKQRELRILVTGKTGQGKSTLINGILGCKVATEGAGNTRCTTEVTVYSKTIEGVPIKVFDSPGLQDRTDNEEEYIRGMREQCQELSLILYCTKMINTRLTDDDKNAMIKLTAAFGEKFWEFTVFVLTFANMENVERKDDRDENEIEPHMDDEEGWKELKQKRFEGRLKNWKEGLHQFLIKEVGVSPDIVLNIPIVPTGDNVPTRNNRYPLHLPDRENWFTSYWETCCLRVKDTRLFLKINSSRIVADDSQRGVDKPDEEDSEDEDVEDDDENSDLDLRPLVADFNARRNVFESQSAELQSPVEEIPKKATPSTTQKQKEDTLESQKTIKSPPPVPPPKPKRDRSGTMVHLRQGKKVEPRQAFSMTLPPENATEHPLSSLNRSKMEDCKPPSSPTAHKNLTDQTIHMHPELVKEVAAQTMRRAGIQEAFIMAAKKVIDRMKKPGKWIGKLFNKTE